jgi:hypothetical protein
MRKGFVILILAAVVAALALAAAPAAQAAPTEVHGWTLNRFYGEPGNGHFEMERISLSAAKEVDTDISTYIEWYYHHWVNRKPSAGSPWFLESAFVNYKDKNGNQLRFGKGRNMCFGIVPSYGNRRHSEYGLASETMTQERIVGLQYFGTFADKKAGFGIALHNSLPPGARFAGTDQAFFRDDPVVAHLADKGEGKNLAVSARLTYPVVQGGKVGVSFRTGELRSTDIAFLASKDLVSPGTTDDTNRRWGLDFDYKCPKGFVAQAEYYAATASTLDFKAWDVLLGFEPQNPTGVKFYARYGKLDLDPAAVIPSEMPPRQVTASTYTWDQRQLILSAVKPLRKGKPIWLQLEFIKNMEDPPAGIAEVDNDVLFLELFTGF